MIGIQERYSNHPLQHTFCELTCHSTTSLIWEAALLTNVNDMITEDKCPLFQVKMFLLWTCYEQKQVIDTLRIERFDECTLKNQSTKKEGFQGRFSKLKDQMDSLILRAEVGLWIIKDGANTVVSLKEKEKYVSPQYDLTIICSFVAFNMTTWYAFHQIPKDFELETHKQNVFRDYHLYCKYQGTSMNLCNWIVFAFYYIITCILKILFDG